MAAAGSPECWKHVHFCIILLSILHYNSLFIAWIYITSIRILIVSYSTKTSNWIIQPILNGTSSFSSSVYKQQQIKHHGDPSPLVHKFHEIFWLTEWNHSGVSQVVSIVQCTSMVKPNWMNTCMERISIQPT